MPDNFDLTLDELHLDPGVTSQEPPEKPEDDPINEIEPVASSPEDLEANALAPADLGREEIQKDDGDVKERDDSSDDKKPETADMKEETNDNMTGIERYLSQFDVEGGMISFDDGTSVHFDELDAEKQREVLSQLHGTNSSSVEEKYGLDENEIGLINYLRTNKMSVDDMVENMVADRVNTYMAIQDVETQDFDKMAEDAVYLQFLKRSNSEATMEQLEDDLGKAKEQTNFSKVVDSLRNQFKSEQQVLLQGKLAQDGQEQAQLVEDQRQQVVDAVLGIDDVAGVKLNDSLKNNILDRVLEVNEYGDSRFMEEVFGDPQHLFGAAFWYYYGPSLLEQRDTYWKHQKSAAYKRGREEALGKDSTKISFTSAQKQVKQGAAPADDDDWLSLHT